MAYNRGGGIIGTEIIGTGWRDEENLGRWVRKIFSENILMLEVN